MNEQIKLIIYYKPDKYESKYVQSLTYTISRINLKDNTYKMKLLLEHNSQIRNQIEEYKMKEFHLGAKDVLAKIALIDFKKKRSPAVQDDNHEYFLIQYGANKIETSDRETIKDILDMFKIDELAAITHKHYQYIKDMYEYIELIKILNSKTVDLSYEHLIALTKMFKTSNPYDLFENMGYLNEYIDQKICCDEI